MTGSTEENMPAIPSFALKVIVCFLLVCCLVDANAQLCTGSLGDPVVNITFGHGANPGPSLNASTTNYTYVSNDCPNDGSYTVRNSTSSCFGNSWFSLTSDHTGDPQGYFMLVNASYAPSDFYLQKIDGLCPSTTYEFSAWMINMIVNNGTIMPNITFSIERTDGTILNSYNTGDIPVTTSPQWKQYGFYFTTPPDVTSVVIRMKNNAPGGIGNDLALDDITFRPCGPKVIAENTSTLTDTTNLCEGATGILTFNGTISAGFNHPISQWQVSKDNGVTWNDIPGANSTTFNRLPTTAGIYMYRLTVSESLNSTILSCRIASGILTVNVHPNPSISLSTNSPICAGTDLALKAAVDYNAGTLNNIIWTGPDGSIPVSPSGVQPGSQPFTATIEQVEPNVVQSGNYKYYLFVQNSLGCSSKDSISVIVNKLPNADFSIADPGCEKKAMSFTDQSSGSPAVNQWNWDFGDGSHATVKNTAHAYNYSGNYEVKLKATDLNGCSDSLVKKVIVHSTPKADFQMPEICVNDPVAAFTNRSSISDGTGNTLTYLWGFGDPSAGTANPDHSFIKDPQHRYSSAGTYPVQLTVTSDQGCTEDTTKLFTVNGSRVATAFKLTKSLICSSDTVVMLNQATVNTGNIVKLEIFWDFSNDPSVKTVDDNPQPGKAYLFHYSFNGQTSEVHRVHVIAYSGISCFDTKDTTITIYRTPAVQFTSLNDVCENVPAFTIVQASETSGLTGTSVFNGAGISVNGLFNPSLASPGTHILRYTFTSTDGCASDAEQTIVVHPKPAVNAGQDKVILRGGGIVLQAQASGNGLQYNWTPPDFVDHPDALNPKVSPTSSQVYTLKATSADGCINEDSVFITVVNGLYIPNAFTPNHDGLNDVWRLPYLDNYQHTQVTIFNRWGQQVFHSTGAEVVWDGTINGQPAPAGVYVYLIDLKDGGGVYKGTLTVIR